MPGPLDGVKVVELGVFVAGPAAGGLLADWGADVVKVEAPGGDVFRNAIGAVGGAEGLDAHSNSPSFYMDNRGKRSVVLDLKTPEGLEALHEMCDRADVFLTNVNQSALDRLGIAPAAMLRRHPRLVVCPVTAYGTEGADRDRPGYDVGAFWARSSLAWQHTESNMEYPPPNAAAGGDHITALAAASGILAALMGRARTGKGDVVTASLLRTGMYANGWQISARFAPRYAGRPAAVKARPPRPGVRERRSPLIQCYRTRDRKFIWLLGFENSRHWPPTVAAVGRPEWRSDARFASAGLRLKNAPALTALLDAEFAKRDAAEWYRVLDEHGVWWQPVQTEDDVVRDPQTQPGFVTIPPGTLDRAQGGREIRSVKGPVDFGSFAASPAGPVPAAGEHTEEVLRAAGYSGERLAALLRKAKL